MKILKNVTMWLIQSTVSDIGSKEHDVAVLRLKFWEYLWYPLVSFSNLHDYQKGSTKLVWKNVNLTLEQSHYAKQDKE